MKEEIVTLVEVATKSINELESYLFNNLKEKYIISKGILDNHKEHIENIKGILESNLTEEEIDMAKADLTLIIETIKNGKNGLNYPAQGPVEETTPVISETAIENDFNEKDIDALLNALDENKYETVFPKEEVPVVAIENTISNFEQASVVTPTNNNPEVLNADYSKDLDINALDAFLNPEPQETTEQNSGSTSEDSFRL